MLGCATSIRVVAETVLKEDISGTYYYLETVNNKPAFKHQYKDFYLFYAEWWKVEVPANYKSSSAVGFIKAEENVGCPEEVEMGKWVYYESHLPHTEINVTECKFFFRESCFSRFLFVDI